MALAGRIWGRNPAILEPGQQLAGLDVYCGRCHGLGSWGRRHGEIG